VNLGEVYRRTGRLREAGSTFRRAMDLALVELQENPRSGFARAYIAYCAARLDRKEQAEAEIAQAVRLSPGDDRGIRRAVLTYEALGERDRALAMLTNATSDLFRQLARHPDLREFAEDPRFQAAARQAPTKKER